MRTSAVKRIMSLFLTALLAAGASLTAHAASARQGIIPGTSVPAGVVIDGDSFLSGQNVVIDGTVNGNVAILGDQVTINGSVNGSLIVLGQNTVIAGRVTGSTYVAALTLESGPESSIDRDLYFAGISLVTDAGAEIQRDLFAIGLDAGMAGHVGRSLHTVIGPIQLYNGLMRLLGFPELATTRIHVTLPPPSTPTPQPAPTLARTATPMSTGTPGTSGSSFNMASAQMAVSAPARHAFAVQPYPTVKSTGPSPEEVSAWAIQFLRNWGILFFLGLLALWLLNRPLERAGAQLRIKPMQSLALGLLVLVIAVCLFGVALLLAVLIFVTGLVLAFIGLWGLSIVFWAAAYACLALLVAALWTFIVYGSKIVVAFLAIDWLLGRLWPAAARYKILSLLLGTLLYALLNSIPLIGWVISVLVTAAGMGAAWLAYRGNASPPAALPVPASQPAVLPEPPPAPPVLPAPARKRRTPASF